MWNKIQRIYVGSNQVRPKYEYSYDFRNKSSTILTNDGWTIVKGTPSFNNYGVRWADIRLTRDLPSLTNAKKIIFYCSGTVISGSNIACRVANSVTSSSSVWVSGVSLDTGGNRRQVRIYDTNTNYSGLSTWTYTSSLVFDLANKTFTLTTSWLTTQTWTITDTQISNIRANTKKIYIFVDNSGSSTSWGLATMWITIEY